MATILVVDDDQAIMDAIRHDIGRITEGEKALLRARDAVVEADERRVRLVAILVGLASLVTRAVVELYLTRRGMGDAATRPTPTDLSPGTSRGAIAARLAQERDVALELPSDRRAHEGARQ